MRPPLNQTCPKCDHKFRTKMGLTSKDIDKMREKVLAYDFRADVEHQERLEVKAKAIKEDNSRWGRFRRFYLGIK